MEGGGRVFFMSLGREAKKKTRMKVKDQERAGAYKRAGRAWKPARQGCQCGFQQLGAELGAELPKKTRIMSRSCIRSTCLLT